MVEARGQLHKDRVKCAYAYILTNVGMYNHKNKNCTCIIYTCIYFIHPLTHWSAEGENMWKSVNDTKTRRVLLFNVWKVSALCRLRSISCFLWSDGNKVCLTYPNVSKDYSVFLNIDVQTVHQGSWTEFLCITPPVWWAPLSYTLQLTK